MSNWMWMTAVLVLVGTRLALADDASKQVAGRVLDEAGRPAAGVTVAPVWIANGLRWDQIKEIQKTGKTEELWRNEGRMEPMGTRFATTDAEGRFTIGIRDRENTLMALDEGRSKGAIIRLGKGRKSRRSEARLQPLVRVSGSTTLSGGDKPLQWSMVYLNLPPDPSEPLSRRRIGICGSFKTQFVFLVPPGEYVLSAFSDSPTAESVEDRSFKVVAGQDLTRPGHSLAPPQPDDPGSHRPVQGARHLGQLQGEFRQGAAPVAPHRRQGCGHRRGARATSRGSGSSFTSGPPIAPHAWARSCPS